MLCAKLETRRKDPDDGSANRFQTAKKVLFHAHASSMMRRVNETRMVAAEWNLDTGYIRVQSVYLR
jgi:hypothetical protein